MERRRISLKEIMQRVGNDLITVGREKGMTEELIKKGNVTIVDAEMVERVNKRGEKEMVFCYVVEEFPNKFFYAGAVLKSRVDQAVAEYFDGVVSDFIDAIKEEKLPVRFYEGKTKAGDKVTLVDFI